MPLNPTKSFQDLILTLHNYWAEQGCVILQPYDMEVGAGTFHPATTLRSVGPKHWAAAYVQPSRRPKDGRYGENPNRLQHYYQYQVIIKPSPPNLQELYLGSLKAIGIDSGYDTAGDDDLPGIGRQVSRTLYLHDRKRNGIIIGDCAGRSAIGDNSIASDVGQLHRQRLVVLAHQVACHLDSDRAGKLVGSKRHCARQGRSGIKIGGIQRDLMEAMEDEAHKLGLRIAHHVGVEETNAWDDVKFGTTSIEHWYGIPDAAIPDLRQKFPSNYNYSDETDRFRWAGRLWREADPAILDSLLGAMVKAKVAWVPTMDIYEASRDLQRAQTQPWFQDYLHPSLANCFKPDPANHGSYFIGWSSTDEVYWKENYRLWMDALRKFERKGGIIGCGDDAGFIYELYGYALVREMELHAEAGFNPLPGRHRAGGVAAGGSAATRLAPGGAERRGRSAQRHRYPQLAAARQRHPVGARRRRRQRL